MRRVLFGVLLLFSALLFAETPQLVIPDLHNTVIRDGREYDTYYYDYLGNKNYLLQLYDMVALPHGVEPMDFDGLSVGDISLSELISEPLENLQNVNLVKLPIDKTDRASWLKVQKIFAEKSVGFWPVVTYHAVDPLPLDGDVDLQFLKYTTVEQKKALLARFHLEIVEINQRDDNGVKVKVPVGGDPFAVAVKLYESGFVRWAQPSWLMKYETRAITPNDPYFNRQWHLTQIQAPSAWVEETGDASVKIAIVDSGVDTTHPDLNVITGYDFIDGDSDANPNFSQDDHHGMPHGTACAGLAAAKSDNGLGVAGGCWGCSIIPVRLIGDEGIHPTTMRNALEYAVDQGAWVINNSWGPPGKDKYGNCITSPVDSSQAQAVDYARTNGRGGKGTIMVWAAGNDGCNTSYQGSLKNDDIIVVSAIGSSGSMEYYSNYGVEIDVAAGAGNVTTDTQGGTGYNYNGSDGDNLSDLDYTSAFAGTSAAAPVTSGAIATMMAANPDMTFSGVLNCVKASAFKTTKSCNKGGWASQTDPYLASGSKDHSPCYGFGVVDLLSMVVGAKNGTCGACVSSSPIDLCYGVGTGRDDDCNEIVDDDCKDGGKGRAADPCTAENQCLNVAGKDIKCEMADGWDGGYCTATCTKNTDCYNGATGVECYDGRCIAHCDFNTVRSGYACLAGKILPEGTEVIPVCGNKIKEDGELCDGKYTSCAGLDGGFTGGYAYCEDDCKSWDISQCSGGGDQPFCGDGKIEGAEVCDGGSKPCEDIDSAKPEGNASCKFDCSGWDASECNETSVVEPLCGNGIKESGEECDDGNTTPNDGCDQFCKKEATSSTGVCGNRIKESGEECDDGNTTPSDGCDQFCKIEPDTKTLKGGCSSLFLF
ncbi:S8 family serine peptidase [bacterium]|nr:S8 family serine peptidase [bacterium]